MTRSKRECNCVSRISQLLSKINELCLSQGSLSVMDFRIGGTTIEV